MKKLKSPQSKQEEEELARHSGYGLNPRRRKAKKEELRPAQLGCNVRLLPQNKQTSK